MDTISKDKVCPFCPKYFLKYHTKPILKNGKYWLMTHNAWPYDGAQIHLIFVLKKHKEHLGKLSPDEWQELLKFFKEAAKKFSVDGGAAFLRFGNTDKTGGSVSHIHAQLLMGDKRNKKAKPLMVQLGYKK